MSLAPYALRELLRRPGRSLLTVLGIAVGVATVVANTTAMHAARSCCADLFDDLSGPRAVEVMAAGNSGFDGGIAAEMARLPGVRAAVPRVQGAAALLGRSGTTALVVLGVDLRRPEATERLLLRDGRGLQGDGEVLLEAGLAERNGLSPGDKVRMWGPAGRVELVVVGRLRPSATALVSHVQAVVPLTTAQRLFALGEQVNGVQCLLADDADPEGVAAEVQGRLPVGLTVQAPVARAEAAEATRAGVEQGLAALSGVALVAAAFVVFNTFLMSLGAREREIALLRSLGATVRQVRRLLLGQAVLLGAFGALLGCGIGLLLARVLLRVLGAFLGVALQPEPPQFGTWLLALALGIGAALAAIALPARRTAGRPVLELLQQTRTCREERLPRATLLGGLLLLLAAGGSFAISGAVPVLLPTAVAALLGGCALCTAPLVPHLLALCGLLPRWLVGVEAELALRQLRRRPVRTALTAGVLVVVVSMALGFGNFLADALGALRQWCVRTIPADFLVQSSVPDTAFLLATALPEALADEIGAFPGVSHVARISFLPAQVDGAAVLVLARTFDRAEALPLDLRDGRPAAVRDGLLQGEAVVGTGLAHTLGVHVGDSIRLDTAHGPQELRIAGTATEFAGGGRALYLEWNAAKALLHFPGAHILLVSADPGQVGRLGSLLRNFCEQKHLLLQTNDELRGQIDALFARVRTAFWALVALAFVIASVGVANTLTLNVREQLRELAVLRAVGMTSGSLRRVVLWQAVWLALVSLGPGTVIGLGLNWVIAHAAAGLLGSTGLWRLHPRLFLGCCVMVLAVPLVSALLLTPRLGRTAARETT
jgi:putative ABC transport system permease protein